MTCPETPECDRLNDYRSFYAGLEEFLEWLEDNRYYICESYDYRYDRTSDKDLVLRFLEIDPTKLEEERRALLDYQRGLNDRSRE